MYRHLLGFSLTVAPLSLAVALVAMGFSPQYPAWWSASVHLAILGGVAIMIYGVNMHSVPEHSGRAWPSTALLLAQIGAGVTGAWLAFLGRGFRIDMMEQGGHLLATVGAGLFMTNLGLLFRQPGPSRPPKIPVAERTSQQRVDRLAIPFTIISGLMAVAGTALGFLLSLWSPGFGRWDLAWAHVMLLGFFFPMASGTSYHMLSRWTDAPWLSIRLVQVHLYVYLVSFPLMIVALGWNVGLLFMFAGPLMAISMIAWALNIGPMAMRLRGAIGPGIVLALIFLTLGVGLGVMFALNPETGPRLRGAHVAANLYGFAGLLISGFGYGFIPRLTGRARLRWPALAPVQLTVLAGGVSGGLVAMGMWMYGHVDASRVLVPSVIAAAGMGLFAAQVAGNFWAGGHRSRAGSDAATRVSTRPSISSVPTVRS